VKNADDWTADLPAGRQLILCLGGKKTDTGNLRPQSVVVWRMTGDQGSIPAFCFSDLTIYGERTPFADEVAGYLCEHCGTHFITTVRLQVE
jgi:hypothetical protein